MKRRRVAALLTGLALLADGAAGHAATPPAALPFCDRGPGLAARGGAPAWVRALAEPIARARGVDPDLVLAVIAVESAYNARAVSPKNAQGLMQLIPETAKRFRVEDPFDPAENVRGGASYLRWLNERFAGNTALVLAGYNAGEGAVEAHGGIPPFAETQRYVQAVARHYVCRSADAATRQMRWRGFAGALGGRQPVLPALTTSRAVDGPARRSRGPVRIAAPAKAASLSGPSVLRCVRRAELQANFRVCRFD